MREYPTDEELELFIEELEKQKLYAPKHMKEQILSQAFPKQTVEVLPKSGSTQKPVTVFAYRLKIIAGMAAALLMLAVIPMQSAAYGPGGTMGKWQQPKWQSKEQQLQNESKVDVNAFLNERMRKVNEKMNTWVGKNDAWEIDGLFEETYGGK